MAGEHEDHAEAVRVLADLVVKHGSTEWGELGASLIGTVHHAREVVQRAIDAGEFEEPPGWTKRNRRGHRAFIPPRSHP